LHAPLRPFASCCGAGNSVRRWLLSSAGMTLRSGPSAQNRHRLRANPRAGPEIKLFAAQSLPDHSTSIASKVSPCSACRETAFRDRFPEQRF
jgi:hypothetical protein